MLLFISESPGPAVPDSTYTGGTHQLNGGIFGVLGFTKPLEKLVLRAVPLQNLLDWLSKPKGPYLVEASAAAAPDKALVLAVTKQMLYGEETPLVGVGLMYKPHYISTEPFCAAYMHLHVWHAAGSSVELADKLNSSCLIFVNVSEMSDVIPVVMQHPILLDVATKDTMMRIGESMAPLSFRGFRLHTMWTQQSGGDLVRQVAFPHFLGDTTTSMLESPQVVAGSSRAALPTETTHQGERALETACKILEHIHTICLQTMHEMGGMRELEQTLVCTLMAEFVRLQLILGEDLTKSLTALHSELETSSEALSSDLVTALNLHSDDLAFPQVKELIQKYQQSISMKVNLPLMELGAAREDIEGFLQRCLRELSSQSESQEMIKELSRTLSVHTNRI